MRINLAHLSTGQKLVIFAFAVAASVIACPVIAATTSFPLYLLLALTTITILTPLVTGLFVYKGKLVTFFVVLTAVAIVAGLLVAIPGVIADHQFRQMCENKGSSYSVIYFDPGYATCTGPIETDYVDAKGLFGPFGAIAYPIFVASIFINLVNIICLPFRLVWVLVRRPAT